MGTTILFLCADPRDTSRLRLGEELREIGEKLQLARLREEFTLVVRSSVRAQDLSQALLDTNPAIVHFSGHGSPVGAICLEDMVGNAHEVSTEALSALFRSFGGQTRCVVLNACYSRVQAEAIAQHVSYVVGMADAIDDDDAIAFSVGFYQAIGAGRSIEDAFDLGCTQLQLRGASHLVPELLRRKDFSSSHQQRIFRTPGGTITMLRKGRTVSEDPLGRQRIGFTAFADPDHGWELAAIIEGGGDPWQSAQLTAGAAQVLRTVLVETLMPKLCESPPIPAQTVLDACVLCADLGAKAAIKAHGLPEGIGAKMAVVFRTPEAIHTVYVGGCGALAVWEVEDGRAVRQINLRTVLTVQLSSPDIIATPLGHLAFSGDVDPTLVEQLEPGVELHPEAVPLNGTDDFLILTSDPLPSSEAARRELVEHVARLGSAPNVSRFLVEREFPEESMVVCYSWDRPLAGVDAAKP